jgi:hypothetical protein
MDNQPDTVSILGAEWKIVYRKKKEDAGLQNRGGYCDESVRTIVVRKFHDVSKPHECADLRAYERLCLRHEIVHAFLYESGLSHSSREARSWATNEEMVDWIAYQGPKIFEAYKSLGLL